MYFPLFLDLSQKQILVVGAGSIACRRFSVLLGFAGQITVVAPRICGELFRLEREGSHCSEKGKEGSAARKTELSCLNHKEGVASIPGSQAGNKAKKSAFACFQVDGTHVTVFQRCFSETDLEGKDLVLAATDDAGLNHRICELCRAQGIPVNVCTDAKDCDFQFPSIVESQNVVIGINAAGLDHRLVKETRKKIEVLLDVPDFQSRYP